jgi:V-type H+-transporting ATPase subunit a
MNSRHKNNYVGEEDEDTPLLAKDNMENQNMGYTADDEDKSKPPSYDFDPSVDTTDIQGSSNHQIEERYQNNVSTTSPQTKPESTPGSLFRSEEMTLCQLFLQSEAAYTSISYLGELGNVQFRDLNPDTNSFQRKFVGEVRRCDEMERKLRFLEKEIKKDEIIMLDPSTSPEAPQPREMIDMEVTFEKLETELQGVNQNSGALRKNFVELTELKHILKKTQTFFQEQGQIDVDGGFQEQQLVSDSVEGGVNASGLQLGFVAGVINRERIPAFETTLWRACRGNVFLKQTEIEDALEDVQGGDNEKVNKSVIVIFFQGDQLKSKVKKICEGYKATMYPCPDQANERKEMVDGVMQRLEDLSTVLNQTNDHRYRVLAAAAKNIKTWLIKVRKLKAIYHVLNMFNDDVTQKCLIAECWVPTADIDVIQLSLKRASEKSGSSVSPILNQIATAESPPTYFRTNKLTSAFQELINSYGVASYREVNPAVYTIITFPFLFAIMFGDAGHGTIMLLFALWMCIQERQLEAKKIDSEIWKIFFAGRYLIAIMSVFSIFTGLIYNDIFAKSFNIFGSSFQVYQNDSVLMSNSTKTLMIDPADPYCNKTNPSNSSIDECTRAKGYYGSPYVFGIDPIWQVATNKIEYLNAFKMKVSIILGVIHMLFGVFMSLKNHLYFKNTLSIFAEFIPQVIFLCGLFGYLSFMMVIKWWLYFPSNDPLDLPSSEGCAPSILITFINMVMFKSETPLPGCETVYMFSGQQQIQYVLLIASVLCVPIMLLVKPFVMRDRHKKAQMIRNGATNDETMENEEAFDFSEIMILQGIHTIEYVLGSVSHTASYLRLWALSLAHSQLSEVLWNMVMKSGFSNSIAGAFMLYAIFAGWAALTVSILVLMEGLSAFLHTLRLHWVEFQSKFYQGEGTLFIPFSFKIILAQAEEESSG